LKQWTKWQFKTPKFSGRNLKMIVL